MEKVEHLKNLVDDAKAHFDQMREKMMSVVEYLSLNLGDEVECAMDQMETALDNSENELELEDEEE